MNLALEPLKAGRVVGHLRLVVAVHPFDSFDPFGRPIFRPDAVQLIWLTSAVS
jgi:hypothetical protein